MVAGSYNFVGIVNPGGCHGPSLFPTNSSSTPGPRAFFSFDCFRRTRRGGGGRGRGSRVTMATSPASSSPQRKILKTSNHLRHVDSMSVKPSGAGKVSQLNAVILGEALASEAHDLVFPSRDFSSQALVSSPEKVFQNPNFFFFFNFFFTMFLFYLILIFFGGDDHQYEEMYKRSVEDPAGFWSDIASDFYWKEKWSQPVCSENLDVRNGNIKIEVL